MRRFLAAAALMGLLAGTALAQSTRFAEPSVVFDDSGFNYAGDLVGSLTFERNLGTNTLMVALLPGEVEGGLRFTTTEADRAAVVGLDRASARTVIGIDVSPRSIEVPFDLAATDPYEVLSYFHERLPALGFQPNQELFGGTSYVFTCSCSQVGPTGARLTLDRLGTKAYVRLVLELPSAY